MWMLVWTACKTPPNPSADPPSPPPAPAPAPVPEPAPTEPVPAPDPAAPGAGTPCPDAASDPGLECVSYFGIAGPRGPKFTSCEIRCDPSPNAANVCPSGQHCTVIADGPGPVCR